MTLNELINAAHKHLTKLEREEAEILEALKLLAAERPRVLRVVAEDDSGQRTAVVHLDPERCAEPVRAVLQARLATIHSQIEQVAQRLHQEVGSRISERAA